MSPQPGYCAARAAAAETNSPTVARTAPRIFEFILDGRSRWDSTRRHASRTIVAGHALGAVLLLLLVCGCGARRHPHPSQEFSGFLDDYSFLREGGPGEVALVYRNPNTDWTRYDEVLLEPVTLWRSGRNSLGPVPEDDLLRLVSDFENALRRQLGAGFRLVDQPGPGVMRIRLAITEARVSDPILDVLRARSSPLPPAPGGPIDPELRRFIDDAAIEGEIRDSQTNELLAAGIDRRREGTPPLDTWAAIQRALDAWTERLCARLERRTLGEQKS